MRRVTVTEIYKHPSMLSENLPFQVLRKGKVVCEVVAPGASWKVCENCGETTQSHIDYEKNGVWETIVLCEKCQEELL